MQFCSIWGVLLFAAEFAYMKFRKYFGFLRKRLGRAIMHLMCVRSSNALDH